MKTVMKTMMIAAVLAVTALVSVAEAAGQYRAPVTVAHIYVYSGDAVGGSGYAVVVFSTTGGSGVPSCASTHNNSLIIDLGNAGGGLALGVLEQALAAQEAVNADGMGSCSATLNNQYETLADAYF